MMDEQLELQLIACLDALEAGETIEQILQRYPAGRDQLRPLLETALAVREIQPTPSSSARIASRRAFLTAAQELPQPKGWFSLRLAGIALALLLCITLGTGSVVASEQALPGDTLYAVKRGVEQARLVTSTNRTTLERQLEEVRREEVRQLIASGRVAVVEFSGRIEALQVNMWVVAGVRIQITQTTQITGSPAIGADAHIQGQVQGNRIVAEQVQIEAGSAPQPPSLPTVTPTPSATPSLVPPTASPIPSATPSPVPPTASPTPSATSSPVPPTATARAAPTAQPTAVPTALPTALLVEPTQIPVDNSNDNGSNDNSNDNGSNDNSNDNGSNDNSNDNGSNDNSNDNGSNDNSNDTGSNDNSNDNSNDTGSNDNSNDSGSNDNDNDNGNDSGSNDNGNDNSGSNDNSNDDNSGNNDNDSGGSDDP